MEEDFGAVEIGVRRLRRFDGSSGQIGESVAGCKRGEVVTERRVDRVFRECRQSGAEYDDFVRAWIQTRTRAVDAGGVSETFIGRDGLVRERQDTTRHGENPIDFPG